jgi:hypothetical protein
MFARLAFLAVFGFASVSSAEEKRTLSVSTSKALPKIESVSVYKAGAMITGKEKAKPVVTAKFGEPITLPDDGPFDVYVKPRGQENVLAAAKLSVKAGKAHEIKIGDLFGTVQVFQSDDSPRLGKIVITSQDDPGPDEKGHVAVQVGTEYRDELVVPDGVYAVWLVSGNGAGGQRIADRIRVLPGKNVRVGD